MRSWFASPAAASRSTSDLETLLAIGTGQIDRVEAVAGGRAAIGGDAGLWQAIMEAVVADLGRPATATGAP